jgi:hypothetical protein
MEVSMDVKPTNTRKTNWFIPIIHRYIKKSILPSFFNNAFQPGSEMDARIQSIKDPDGRMVSKKKVGDKEIKESRIKI